MPQHLYAPTGRPALENVPYPVYYVPVQWVAAPNPPSYTISSLDTCPIATSSPALPTGYLPITPAFDHRSAQRTDNDVIQHAPRPVYDSTSTYHLSQVEEASSSNLTRKSPYHSYGHPERPENRRTRSPLHSADRPSRLGVETSSGDHQFRKSTSPPSNSSVARFSRRQLTHLESERKRRESVPCSLLTPACTSADDYRAINAGLEALRRAIPGCEGDSKAVILEKAVKYISHLESLVRDARVRGAADCRSQSSEEEALIKTEPE